MFGGWVRGRRGRGQHGCGQHVAFSTAALLHGHAERAAREHSASTGAAGQAHPNTPFTSAHESVMVSQLLTLIGRCCRVSICCSQPAETVLCTCSSCDRWPSPHTHKAAACYPHRHTSGPSLDSAPRPLYSQRLGAQRSRFTILCLDCMGVGCVKSLWS